MRRSSAHRPTAAARGRRRRRGLRAQDRRCGQIGRGHPPRPRRRRALRGHVDASLSFSATSYDPRSRLRPPAPGARSPTTDGAGTPNKTLAAELYISLNTVRNHVQSILYKLDAHSKLEAVATAVRAGLIELDDGMGPSR